MIARDTRAFMALMANAQHNGRPSVPTDEAWIESSFGHIKASGRTWRPSPIPLHLMPN
jgi:putative transposase